MTDEELDDFNPRSHKGSDKAYVQIVPSARDFNPRSHKGSDYIVLFSYDSRLISIHAPTRGATCKHNLLLYHNQYFNPRSHKGSDYAEGYYSPSTSDFNPRSHKGSDFVPFPQETKLALISIHAPTRGATDYILDMDFLFSISIHAPTRGATFCQIHTEQHYQYFNPRSHKGSDNLSF